jgi:hypothetical protein
VAAVAMAAAAVAAAGYYAMVFSVISSNNRLIKPDREMRNA